MNTYNELDQILSQDEVNFLNKVFKGTDIKSFDDFLKYIENLREGEPSSSPFVLYADLLETIVRFVVVKKREYDEDRVNSVKATEEIDKSIDRVMLVLLKGLLLAGYAPGDDVKKLMKKFNKNGGY